MKKTPNVMRNERGQALAIIGMGLGSLAFVALVAVGIDTVHQSHVANEVQTLADVTALAGAQAVMSGGNAVTDANILAQQNLVNGVAAVAVGGTSCSPSGGPCAALQTGFFTPTAFTMSGRTYTTGTFNYAGEPTNAVQVNAFAQVDNIIGGFPSPLAAFTGSLTTQKTARAAFVTISSAIPNLPMAIGACDYTVPGCVRPSCLPKLTQSPSPSDNSWWTGFFSGHSQPAVESYFPSPCGAGTTPPALKVGDTIDTSNTPVTALLDDVQCLLKNGLNPFLVPVVACGGGTQVVGFATIVIDSVDPKPGGKGITLHGVPNFRTPGRAGGCSACGTGFIALAG